MFTGIIETTGKIISLEKGKGNICFTVEADFASELKIGQSVSHNGVCLTVETRNKSSYTVTAVKETLAKTNLDKLKKGSSINLERALKIGDRLDGHFVQGHVDTTATCTEIKKEKGSWIFKFEVRSQKSEANSLVIDKGSICINGVSLTIVQVSPLGGDLEGVAFSVAIIPHTFKHTNFCYLQKNDTVNIEFDVLGKYIQKLSR